MLANPRRVEHIMGFPISVDIPASSDLTPALVAAIDRAFDWLREVDVRFSPFRPDSEVSRLNREELGPAELSDDLIEVLRVCRRYEERTGGAFSVRLPGRGLDPCAVVKGWAVQRAAESLMDAGARTFCVNAGGDVVAAGQPGRPWRVGVRHPEHIDQLCAVLAVRDAAVATSARYERGKHILDGRTGLPARGLKSVTVVADTLTIADTTATAAFALGAEGAEWAAAQPGCQVFAVTETDQVFRSPDLPLV